MDEHTPAVFCRPRSHLIAAVAVAWQMGIAISFWTFVCVFESRTSVHNLIKTISMKTSITYKGRHFRKMAKESQSPDPFVGKLLVPNGLYNPFVVKILAPNGLCNPFVLKILAPNGLYNPFVVKILAPNGLYNPLVVKILSSNGL